MFTKQLNICQQFLIYIDITTRLFRMRMSNAATQIRSTKGPLLREDYCTLPVFF